MAAPPRPYRKKPVAVFEHGTRIYAPSRGESRWRVAADAEGTRVFHKVGTEEDARARARVIEADLARRAPLRPAEGTRTVATLAQAYLASLDGAWSPADSERLLNLARRRLAPATIQGLGSVLRSLVTYAHKARWLPPEADPMWHVAYSAKATHQGQAVGFVVRDELSNDQQCAALFAALVKLEKPTWALAMRLAYRSGVRWEELVALRPVDIAFEPHRSVHMAGLKLVEPEP